MLVAEVHCCRSTGLELAFLGDMISQCQSICAPAIIETEHIRRAVTCCHGMIRAGPTCFAFVLVGYAYSINGCSNRVGLDCSGVILGVGKDENMVCSDSFKSLPRNTSLSYY